MINRRQTLFLVLALALMVAFFFVPFGYNVDTIKSEEMFIEQPLTALNQGIALIAPVALALVCIVAAIFLYKSLSSQKALIVVAALFVGATVGIVVYYLTAGYSDTNPDIAIRTVWGGGGLLLVATLIALIAAWKDITHDQKILRSYERLR